MATYSGTPWLAKGFTASFRFMVVSRSFGGETRRLRGIRPGSLQLSCNDSTSVKESGTVDYVGNADIGSDLLRVYLDAEFHDGTKESVALGTYLVNAPERTVDGRVSRGTLSLTGRLQELADAQFARPLTVKAGANPVEEAAHIVGMYGLRCAYEHTDYKTGAARTYGTGGNGDESVLDAVNDLLELAGFRSARTDAYGMVHFNKYVEPTDSIPVWYFEEGANARFLSEVTEERDMSGVANVVRVTYSTQDKSFVGIARDDDPKSAFSTVAQGREICRTETLSDVPEKATGKQIQQLADKKAAELLRTGQSVIHRITLSTVWCPIWYHQTARISYPSAGIDGVFAIRTINTTGSPGALMEVELRRFER